MTGTLHGLGVGPGDPDLITIKAVKLLRAAPVIAWPAPETGPSLARRIADPHLRGCSPIEVAIRMPLAAARFPADAVFDRAARTLGRHLRSGRNVAVLCEGDPFFYGSFIYLFARMARSFPVEVVPGVSSLMACAAALGQPLAARNDVLTILPAPLEAPVLERKIAAADACAIIKPGRHMDKVRAVLDRLQLADQAGCIEHATMTTQRIRPLTQVTGADAPYFSMIIVHKRGRAWRPA